MNAVICGLNIRIGEVIAKAVNVNCLEGLGSLSIGGDRLMKYKKQVVAIIGSRKYKNKEIMFRILDEMYRFDYKGDLFKDTEMYRFISGGADGPDTWAKEWCKLHNLEFKEYPILKGETPFDRNKRVALMADQIVGFVNKNQFRSGTWNTIRYFRERGKISYRVCDQKGYVWDRKWKK